VGVAASLIIFLASVSAAEHSRATDTVTVSVLAVQASDEGRNGATEGTATAPKPRKKTGVSEQLRMGFAPVDAKKSPRAGTKKIHFDPGLEEIREAVATFPYDTYRRVSSQTASIKRNEEKRFEINKTYTLRLTALDNDETGRLRVHVEIDEKAVRGGKPVTINALNTTSAIAPGKNLMLGGLPLPEGKLIVFISLRP